MLVFRDSSSIGDIVLPTVICVCIKQGKARKQKWALFPNLIYLLHYQADCSSLKFVYIYVTLFSSEMRHKKLLINLILSYSLKVRIWQWAVSWICSWIAAKSFNKPSSYPLANFQVVLPLLINTFKSTLVLHLSAVAVLT